MAKPQFSYTLSLLLIFTLPAAFLAFLVWERIPLLNLILFVGSITLLGSIWDVWATRHGKRDSLWLWQFNHKGTLGARIFGLPIEEYLFYVSSSIYIIFIWEGIKFTLETGNALMYVVIPFLGVWSLLFMLLPYILAKKGD